MCREGGDVGGWDVVGGVGMGVKLPSCLYMMVVVLHLSCTQGYDLATG